MSSTESSPIHSSLNNARTQLDPDSSETGNSVPTISRNCNTRRLAKVLKHAKWSHNGLNWHRFAKSQTTARNASADRKRKKCQNATRKAGDVAAAHTNQAAEGEWYLKSHIGQSPDLNGRLEIGHFPKLPHGRAEKR
jgi:hypothetical protein